MDRRLHLLLLSAVAGGALLASGGARAQAQPDPVGASGEAPQVVEPEVERRKVEPVDIDTENFEVGLEVGTIGIEDFGSSMVYGSRIAYHFTEDFFGEAGFGMSKAGHTSYEDLSGAAHLLTNSERKFSYYDIALGWNALPGEVFFGTKHAMPSALYLTLGTGSTRFAGDDHFTVTMGAGFRVVATDWLAIHIDARDRMFKSDLLGRNKLTQNLQFTISATAFF